jgi:hypothetical protein
VTCTVDDFGNVIGPVSDTHPTNLFQPSVDVVKSGPDEAQLGETITYTFTITNDGSNDSPDLILESFMDVGDGWAGLGDLTADATAAGCGILAPGASCNFTVDYTIQWGDPNPLENTVTVQYHPDGFPNDIDDFDDHLVRLRPPNTVTSSSLCTFDVADTLDGNQFRLNFTMDPLNPSKWILNSTNPGQFYYNVFDIGAAGDPVNLTINIPFPFVTQGANPIQVHSLFDFSATDGEICFEPLDDVTAAFTIDTEADTPVSPSGAQIITFDDYTPPLMGEQTQVTVSGEIPASGQLYITIHLDYGFKKTTGWGKVDADADTEVDDACSTGSTLPCAGHTILHPQIYDFSASSDPSIQTVQSLNRFKRDPGFAGVVNQATPYGEEPLAGVVVQIFGPTGNLVGATITDEDGVYLFVYKHTGKAATYTIRLPAYDIQQTAVVKANGWAIVNFTIPYSP